MATINDAISIGGYTFPLNPAQVQIACAKLSVFKRTLNGAMKETYVKGPDNLPVVKRKFTISGGIDSDNPTMIESLSAVFKQVGPVAHLSIYGETIQVFWPDFGLDISNDNPRRPDYSITLEEM